MGWEGGMRTGAYYVRATLRGRVRSTALLAFIVAAAVAVPVTALAGAQRTASSWDRFLAETRAFDFGLSLTDTAALETATTIFDGAGIDHGTLQFVPLVPRRLADSGAGSFVLGGGSGRDLFVPLLVEGRLADPARTDELTVNEVMATQANLRVGDRVTMVPTEGAPAFDGPLDFEVVGIHRSTLDLGVNAGFPTAFLPEAFDEYVPEELRAPVALIRLPDGVSEPELRTALAAAFPPDRQPVLLSAKSASAAVEDVVSVQAISLAGMGVLAALGGLVVAGQAVARETRDRTSDRRLLSALGAGRASSMAAQTAPACLVVLGGAAVGLTAALASSGRFPYGPSHANEPDPGMRFEPLAHGIGTAAMVVALCGVAFASAIGRHVEAGGRRHVPALGGTALAVGLRWALAPAAADRRSPLRTDLLAVAVAIAGAVTVATFLTSATQLERTPALYGWDFDLAVNAGDDAADAAPVLDSVATAAMGTADAVARVQLSAATIDGRGTEAFVVEQLRDRIDFTILEGRAPTGDDEMAIGADLADELGVSVGDMVSVEGSALRRARVVAIAAYPELGDVGMSSAVSMGAQLAEAAGVAGGMEHLFLRLDGPGGDDLRRRLEATDGLGVDAPFTPPTVANLDQIESVAIATLVALGVLGSAGFAHGMASSARRRRHDIAVLRCLGLRHDQTIRAILVHATCIVVVAVAVGEIAGLVFGDRMWSVFAGALGVGDDPVTRGIAVAWTALGALALIAIVGGPVAWAVSRRPPAHHLRVE